MSKKASIQLPRAADFMNTDVRTVSPDWTLDDVTRFLLDHRLSNVPVVAEDAEGRRLVGFISERDCLAALSNECFFGTPAPPQSAETVMRKHPVCVDPDTELFALASIFVSHNYRHLPVTSAGMLKGIVSRRDILRAIQDYEQRRNEENHQRRFRPDLSQIVNLRFLVSD